MSRLLPQGHQGDLEIFENTLGDYAVITARSQVEANVVIELARTSGWVPQSVAGGPAVWMLMFRRQP